MPSPDAIFEKWAGMVDDDFQQTIKETFDLPADDTYIYKAESFAMTFAEIKDQIDSGIYKYKYRSHDQVFQVRI